MKNGFTRTLSLLLIFTLLTPLLPAALAEDAGDAPVSLSLYEIAMTPHPDGYHADPETMTDEEWAAQFACDEYVEEGNAALELSQMAASDINPLDFAKMIESMKNMEDLIKKGAFWVLDYFWKAIMKGEGEDEKFKAIMNKLKDIENKLDEIKRANTVDVYERYLNNQLKERTKLTASIRSIMGELEDVDKALNGKAGKKITKEEAAKRRKAIITKWGTTPIMGVNSGMAATVYYINYVMQLRIRKMTFIGMLDDYIYINLPWEHQGYLARELLRSAEMSTMFSALALSCMYYSLTGQLDSTNGREMIKLTKDVAAWFEKQKVVRQSDKVNVCQIRGEQGSQFMRQGINFSDQLQRGETIIWNAKNKQFCGLLVNYDDRKYKETRRKANVVPYEAWKTILDFYKNKREVLDIYYKEMRGTSAAGNARFISLYCLWDEDDVTQRNMLVQSQYLKPTATSISEWDRHSGNNCWVGYYWYEGRPKSYMVNKVRGWHKKPDSLALMIQYKAGKNTIPSSTQDEGDETTFTRTGPVALVGDGSLTVLNVTDEARFIDREDGAGLPPVLDAPEGGMVEDLFSVADTYFGHTMDISGFDLEKDLKPGQWITATYTFNSNEDGPLYRAIALDPMDIEGVPGTVSQLMDGALTFQPDDGAELAFALDDDLVLDVGIAEGARATLFYHPELVFNDDEEGFCDHQELVLDSIEPLDPEELNLSGTIDTVAETGFAMTTDDGEAYFIDTADAEIEGELVEKANVAVTGKPDGEAPAASLSAPVVKASWVFAFASEEDAEEMDGVIVEADEDSLQVLNDEDGLLYDFDITEAKVVGDPAEGNAVEITYHVAALGLVADTVFCFAPEEEKEIVDVIDAPEATEEPNEEAV